MSTTQTPAGTPVPDKPKKPAEKRAYMVFKPIAGVDTESNLGDRYEVVWRGQTLGPDEALDGYADTLGEKPVPDGLVSLAASAWKPRKPVVEPPPPPKRTWV